MAPREDFTKAEQAFLLRLEDAFMRDKKPMNPVEQNIYDDVASLLREPGVATEKQVNDVFDARVREEIKEAYALLDHNNEVVRAIPLRITDTGTVDRATAAALRQQAEALYRETDARFPALSQVVILPDAPNGDAELQPHLTALLKSTYLPGSEAPSPRLAGTLAGHGP